MSQKNPPPSEPRRPPPPRPPARRDPPAVPPPVPAQVVPPRSKATRDAQSVKHLPAVNRQLPAAKTPRVAASPPADKRKRKVPSWLTSFCLHLGLLIVLACIPLEDLTRGSLTLLLGQGAAGELGEFELVGPNSSGPVEAAVEELPVVAPEFSVSELLELNLGELSTPLAPPSLTSARSNASLTMPFGLPDGLSGRSSGNKQRLLERFGGSAATEEAVEAGLSWLAAQQTKDGSWSLKGTYVDPGTFENKTAATAMALNAFLGAGYTHMHDSKYKDVVSRGLKSLVRMQDDDGFFAAEAPSRQQMYAQAIASICVIEAYGMTAESEMHIAASKAIRFAEWSQSELNGWRYEPRYEADLSVTGWFLMTLVTGKMVGLSVDEEIVNNVSNFLDSVSSADNSRYAYTPLEKPTLTMTAEGILCRIFLGWPKSHPALSRAIEEEFLPAVPREDDASYSVYFWYYATQVLHHVGGKPWAEWNAAMKSTLPKMQVQTGPEKGSWSPALDTHGITGGRLYTTCLTIYCLEVYYRHLSMYEIE